MIILNGYGGWGIGFGGMGFTQWGGEVKKKSIFTNKPNFKAGFIIIKT